MLRFNILFPLVASIIITTGCKSFAPAEGVIEDETDVEVEETDTEDSEPTDTVDTEDTYEEVEETDTQEPQCPNVDGDSLCDEANDDYIVAHQTSSPPMVGWSLDIQGMSAYDTEQFVTVMDDPWGAFAPVVNPNDGSGYVVSALWELDGIKAVTLTHQHCSSDGRECKLEFADFSDMLGVDPAVQANPFPVGKFEVYKDFDNDGYGDEHTTLELGIPDTFVCLKRTNNGRVVAGSDAGSQSECERQVLDAVMTIEPPSGYSWYDGDCWDTNPAVRPGATEVDNDIDDDCDDRTDEGLTPASGGTVWYLDADNDGFGTTSRNAGDTKTATSRPQGYAASGNDCWDTNPAVNPGKSEITGNGIDDDCNSATADGSAQPTATTWYRDADIDGYGDPNTRTSSVTQPVGYLSNSEDCDDARSANHPGAPEVTDSRDNDCDGLIDENSSTGRVTSTWSFKLDATATGMTFDQFEVQNVTAGTATSSFTKTGDTVTISVSAQAGDVLTFQCWLGGNTDWCASNLHNGHIVSATGPNGVAYTVGKTTGDIRYVVSGSGQRYGGTVK